MSTKTLTVLFASAALTVLLGFPALRALHASEPGEALAPLAALLGADSQQRPVTLAEDDGHETEGGTVVRGESDDDEGACGDDDGNCAPAPAAPAPGGSVPPPQNGLFDNGAAPQVQVK